MTDEVVWLRADEEANSYVAAADTLVQGGKIVDKNVIARYHADFEFVPAEKVQYIDVAPSQMVGVSAGLIPFLEHDDANRAAWNAKLPGTRAW